MSTKRQNKQTGTLQNSTDYGSPTSPPIPAVQEPAPSSIMTVESLLLNRRAFVAQRIAAMKDRMVGDLDKLAHNIQDGDPAYLVAAHANAIRADGEYLKGYEAAVTDLLAAIESTLPHLNRVR